MKHHHRFMVGAIPSSLSLWRGLGFALLVVFTTVPSILGQALKESVSKQVKPDDWLKGQREANKDKWNEVDNVSPEMAEILLAAAQSIAPKGDKGRDCDRAAANLAFSVVHDAYGAAALTELLGALKGAASKILSLGEKDLVEWVIEQIKEKGKDAVKEYLREKFSKEKPEVFIKSTTKAGCAVVLISIWNKATGTYDVTVYGNCDCQPQLTGDFNRPSVKLRYFAVHATGKVSIDIKDNIPIVRAGPATVTVDADCNCASPTEKPSTVAPPQTPTGSTVAPEDPCKIKLQCPKPCKECEEIKKKIDEACRRLTEIDRQLRDLAGQKGGNESRQKAARDAKNEEELKDLQREARQLEIDAYALGLEEKRLKQDLKDLAQKLRDCEKKCCGPKESPPRTETPSGKPVSRTENQTAHYYLPSGMEKLSQATANAFYTSPSAPNENWCSYLDCCCYRCEPIYLGVGRNGPIAVAMGLAMNRIGTGRAIQIAYDKTHYAAETYVRWNATGPSGLSVNLEVQRPGSSRFEQLVRGPASNDGFLFATDIPGSYLFRATAVDPSGKTTFNTLSVTFPIIYDETEGNPR